MQHPSLSKSFFPLMFFIAYLIVSCYVNAQNRIPSKLGGFWYRNQGLKIDSIIIEAFIDPLCPDCKDCWPPLKQAVDYYGSSVSLVAHPFPLPYHDNAFICSRVLHIVDKLIHPTETFDLLESFFKHQEVFNGQATSNLSRASIVDKVVNFSAETVGLRLWNSASIQEGFYDSSTDLATRDSFKYGCLKGVYGTPFFFVNGFPLPNAGSSIDYNEWKKIIDPLLGNIFPRGSDFYIRSE